MKLVALALRFRGLQMPAGLLVLLLQRTPMLRVAAQFQGAFSENAPVILRSAFGVVALGAYNTLAGATTFNVTATPVAASPTSGLFSSTFTVPEATGTAVSIAITVTGAPALPRSWSVTGGTLPPGLSIVGATGTNNWVNVSAPYKMTISGTPTVAGATTVKVTAWNDPDMKGDNAYIFLAFNITGGGAGTAPSITTQPISATVTAGSPASFTVAASGSPTPTYQWQKDGADISGATSTTYSNASVSTSDAGNYTAVATNSAGTATSSVATLTVNVAPAFTTQPASQTVTVGANVTFTAAASGSPTPTYQWQKGGANISSATSATLSLTNVQLADAGTYTVVATNSAGSVTSNAAVLTVNALNTSSSYLANLSVRVAMATGQTLIVGFVVDGGAKPILVRAAGPVLNQYGLTGVVDPQLKLFTGGGTQVAANDNWDAALATTFATLGAFPFDTGSKDSAFQQTISGPHSAQATATGPGALLVEAYDVGPYDSRKLVNLSTRFQVGTGDNILIVGFVVAGTGVKQLLIRAVGPTLASYGVPGTLVDPQLSVFNGSTLIASNDDWASPLSATFTTLGAFALNAGSKDAALLVTLQAGKAYSVQVSGVGGGTGEALAEIYVLP
jgi:plastocyanin